MCDEHVDDDLTFDEVEYLDGIIERIKSGDEQLTRLILPQFGEMLRFGSYAILKDEHGFDSDGCDRTVIAIWPKMSHTQKRFGWLPDVHIIRQLSPHWWLVSISKNTNAQGDDDDQ